MSSRVLSCLVDETDVVGLMSQESTSGPSLKFFIDDAKALAANWACEASCYHNNATPDLTEGTGELDIKVEPLRYLVCATSDLLQDASFNVEAWILRKVSNGMRAALNAAIIAGDGIGKPLGILSPSSGIPRCTTSDSTPPGQFTLADLISLKYQIPMSWQAECSWLLNQNTYALMQSMQSADARPLFGNYGTANPGTGATLLGDPVHIVSQMPNLGPGSVPIAYGNWKQTYCVVTRSGVSMRTESAGWCSVFRFECRVGGGTLCPNAARFLLIK